ncbi:hypothetical protein [Pseudomonas indica]|uniref:hypothetical protein n=1 Tax=Pseudomonas indica TaxID=137658 RepID=UPI003FCF583B
MTNECTQCLHCERGTICRSPSVMESYSVMSGRTTEMIATNVARANICHGHGFEKCSALADTNVGYAASSQDIPTEQPHPPSPTGEPLYITHRPLIRNAISLLGMRRPVAPDVERVINDLEALLDGQPTPAGAPSNEWLQVASRTEPSPAQSETNAQLAALEGQEPVAYVLFRDNEVFYDTDDNIVISNKPGDETDRCKWLPVYCKPIPAERTVVVPDGWKLVPAEPTQAMFEAGRTSASGSYAEKLAMAAYWRAMLAAAPQPPVQPPLSRCSDYPNCPNLCCYGECSRDNSVPYDQQPLVQQASCPHGVDDGACKECHVEQAPAQDELPEHIVNALHFSRSFATAKSNIGLTEKEHILGLAKLLEKTARELVEARSTSPAQAAPQPQKYDDVLMPFLAMMRAELHANAGKGDRPGWLQMDVKDALLEIFYHMGKLQKAAKKGDIGGIREYSADVANMAMMLADVCGVLPEQALETAPPAAQDVSGLVEALRQAAQSLESIRSLAGHDELMREMSDVRGYARNRASVARLALSAYQAAQKDGDK